MLFCTIFLGLTALVAHAAPIHPLDKRIQQITAFTTLVAAAESSAVTLTTSVAVAPTTVAAASTSAAIAASPSASSTSDFHLQNGLDAQKFNAQFQTLTAQSSCSEGEQACIGTSFAQCVSGSFVLTPCSAGTICAALPLVNKPGTSITCDTSADVAARIAATGATGGVDGSSQAGPSASADSASDSDCEDSESSSTETPTASSAIAAPAPTSSASGFQAQNGLDAQKLNAQFKTLTAQSSCSEGEQACVGTSFAQCVSGSFVLTPCSAGTICAALPLVNSPGTSIACDTSADVAARISAAGVVGV